MFTGSLSQAVDGCGKEESRSITKAVVSCIAMSVCLNNEKVFVLKSIRKGNTFLNAFIVLKIYAVKRRLMIQSTKSKTPYNDTIVEHRHYGLWSNPTKPS
jgi:hypothetical protein